MPATYDFTPEQLKKIVDKFQPQDNGCWHHPTKPTAKGYGQTRIGWPITRTMLMHHLSWIYYRGDIPQGMVLDHLCHDPAVCAGGNTCEHRRCVNPEHLQLVTSRENSQKTVRLLKFRTHCKHGHDLTNNIYEYAGGKRGCATCLNRKVSA